MMSIRLGTNRKTMPDDVIGWYPCAQANTDTAVNDRSGKGNHLAKGGALTWDTNASTGVWETANRARTRYSSAAATISSLYLTNAQFSAYNSANGDSLVIAWVGAIATPAAAVPIFGNTYMTTAGIRIRVTAAQKLQVSAHNGSAGTTLTSSFDVGGGTERHHLVAIDGATGACTYYRNGEADATIAAAALYTPGDSLSAPSIDFNVGGAKDGASTWGSTLCDFADILILRRAAQGLPSNMATIAKMLYLNRYLYITSEMGW